MIRTYWTIIAIDTVGILLSIFMAVIVSNCFLKGMLTKEYFVGANIAIVVAIILGLCWMIPLIKDYKYVINDKCLEADAVVVEFTCIEQDLDGNGQTSYTKPKFYIEESNEYVVLYASNVEVGKKYRIRYLPNSRLCEIVSLIE